MVNDLDLDAQNYSKVVSDDEAFFYTRNDGTHHSYAIAGLPENLMNDFMEICNDEDGFVNIILNCAAYLIKEKNIDIKKFLDE